VKGTFSRMSPAAFAQKVGIPPGWCVIAYRWVPTKVERRRATGHWFKLVSSGGSTYRILRFSANLKGGPDSPISDIVLDWSAWLELNGYADDLNKPVELKITRPRWWEMHRLADEHPDPIYRMAARLAVLSVVLGTVSLVLTVLPK
jgi:hypothetical protein